MNQRLLIGVIILAGIGSIGSVLAYSGTISAAQGNFNNVLVTGTCSGCGGAEGNYIHYNTIALNTTAITSASENDKYIFAKIGSNGVSTFNGNEKNVVVTLGGTTTFLNDSGIISGSQQFSQSETGKYIVIKNNGATPPTISVMKDGVYLQALGIDETQIFNTDAVDGIAAAISPDGHYILVVASDAMTGDSRVIVFQGS